MAYIPDQQKNTGSFLTTTKVLDVAEIQRTEVSNPRFKDFIVTLTNAINDILIVLNNKISGYFLLEEFINSKVFFHPTLPDRDNLRPVSSIVVIMGAIGAGVTTVPHNIPVTSTYIFINISAVCNDQVAFNYYPLSWASAGGATNIELRATNTDIIITNNSGITFQTCYVLLEYLKY